MSRPTNPPEMAGWNLGLRFVLELAALAGWAMGGWAVGEWAQTSGPLRWAAAIGLPVVMAVAWGVFNVPDDPSRSGKAPVAVDGRVRLVLELLVLAGGAAMMAVADRWGIAAVFAALLVLHYAVARNRVAWLVRS